MRQQLNPVSRTSSSETSEMLSLPPKGYAKSCAGLLSYSCIFHLDRPYGLGIRYTQVDVAMAPVRHIS